MGDDLFIEFRKEDLSYALGLRPMLLTQAKLLRPQPFLFSPVSLIQLFSSIHSRSCPLAFSIRRDYPCSSKFIKSIQKGLHRKPDGEMVGKIYLLQENGSLQPMDEQPYLSEDLLQTCSIEMSKALKSRLMPNMVTILVSLGRESSDILRLADFAKSLRAIKGKATAYVCSNHTCGLPSTEPTEMLKLLGP
jgi:hypothetical protein